MPQKLFFHLFNINIIKIKINIPLITLTNFSEPGSRERCLHLALVTFPPPGHTATCSHVALALATPWGVVLIEVKKDLLVPFNGTLMAVSSLNPPLHLAWLMSFWKAPLCGFCDVVLCHFFSFLCYSFSVCIAGSSFSALPGGPLLPPLCSPYTLSLDDLIQLSPLY